MVSPCLRTEEADAAGEGDAANPDRPGVAEAGGEPVLTGLDGVLAGGEARPAQAVRPTGSISSERSAATSMTMPPSETPWPAGLWPPPRTAISDPVSRAVAMSRATSSGVWTRAMSAGWRSTCVANTVRASS